MEIQTNNVTPSAAPPASSKGLSSDFETFLKMLTTQLRNQDPLNPMDSADYAVQLATFSGVEQSVRTNQLLESMQAQFGVLSMSQLAGWVGQEARAEAPVLMDGAPVSLVLPAPSPADRAVLVVRDRGGAVVAREDVPTGGGNYSWLGAGSTGELLPRGIYSLSLESYVGDVLQTTSEVQHYAPIIEARGGSEGTRLVLRGGIEVSAEKVLALRVP
jgi:flagellar basal-body rod modification protein FlgD